MKLSIDKIKNLIQKNPGIQSRIERQLLETFEQTLDASEAFECLSVSYQLHFKVVNKMIQRFDVDELGDIFEMLNRRAQVESHELQSIEELGIANLLQVPQFIKGLSYKEFAFYTYWIASIYNIAPISAYETDVALFIIAAQQN
jgi:hypothetical protein